MTSLQQQGAAAKAATYVLSTAGTAKKNAALEAIARILTDHQEAWLAANAKDVAAAKEAGMRPAMLDRLTLTPERIAGIVEGVRQVASLPDPIGRVDKMETRPNGLIIGLDVSRAADEYTVATWLRTWYELYTKPNVRTATANRYQLIIEVYTIPRIGDIKLKKLTTRHLQKLYKELLESGRIHCGKGQSQGLSTTTVRSAHLMLHAALERAVKERLIPRNPTEDCIAPKPRKIEMRILPSEDIHAYLEAAKARDLLPMFYLELVSGLRKGELIALRWDDLNIRNKTISVSKQYVRNPDGSLELTRPKTENSVRLVSIPQTAVDLLIQEHVKHPNSPYMFPSPITGEMYHPDSVVNLHKKILKDAGLPHIRFHDLRHTFATTALQNGVDVKTVSSMLGHYDAGFTLRTYTHATRQKQDEAAQTIGTFMEQVM